MAHTGNHTRHLAASSLALLACALLAERADAQEGAGLLGLTYATPIENAAAEANDRVFRTLEPHCNPGGVLDLLPAPEFGDIAASNPGPLCNPDTFHVYLNARELTHTANELQGSGPTVASLGLDLEGLGRALRWTAAEELAAQGAMATQFANGQLATLAARLSALRFGASVLGTTVSIDRLRRSSPLLAQVGGAAEPADSTAPRETFSPWGGFLNYGFGYGNKAPTALENAFDFDGSEVTFGVDYRLRNNVVLGAIIGFTRQTVDFDATASTISVVDGGIETEGRSFIFFGLSQGERLTISGSLGVQSLDYSVVRHIQYPSFNPNIESANSLARSSPEADVTTATFGLGYAFTWTKFTLEPYLSLEYLDITVDSFAEDRSIDRFSNAEDSHRFELTVSGQDVESLKTTAGLRFQYVVTPRIGFIVPFWSIAAHREHQDKSRTITSGYAALAEVLGSTTFVLPTDEPTKSYYTTSAGFSTLFRGGRQRRLDGPVAGGLSGFVQLLTVRNRGPYDDSVLTAGLRYEF